MGYYSGNFLLPGFVVAPGAAISFSWAVYGTTREFDLLLVHDDVTQERLRFTVSPGFFKGENELFSGINGTYIQKALALINKFLS